MIQAEHTEFILITLGQRNSSKQPYHEIFMRKADLKQHPHLVLRAISSWYYHYSYKPIGRSYKIRCLRQK